MKKRLGLIGTIGILVLHANPGRADDAPSSKPTAPVVSKDAGAPSVPVDATPPKRVKPIKVPPIKFFKNLNESYNSGSQPHLLMILHLSQATGAGFIEVHNKTKQDLAIFQFTIHALGHEGELEFEELPAGWSAVKEVKLSSLRELEIRTPRAYDKDATEISPQLIIHRTDLGSEKLEVGKKKIL